MRLSVIIPTYKRAADLPRLFDSLFNQTENVDEVIVVVGPGDFASIAVTKKWTSFFADMHVLEAKKTSVIHALNIGLSNAKEDFICLLDDDVSLPKTWCQKIKDAYKTNKRLGGYGGRDYLQIEDVRYSNPPLALTVGVFNWKRGLIGNHHCGVKKSPAKVDVLKGCNFSFRRSAFTTMQIEPALEGQGAETCWEIDICQHIQLAGFDLVYDNDNYVLHYASKRLPYDDRGDIFSPAWSHRIYNEGVVMAKYRPLTDVLIFSLRTFLVGTRFIPGIIWSLLHLRKYSPKVLRLPWLYGSSLIKGLSHGYCLRKKLIIDLKTFKHSVLL